MIDSKILEKLEAIDNRTWGVIYKELVRYARFKLDKAGFEVRTEKDCVDAEFFATLAIERLFDGTRTWDNEKFPDVKIHLIGIVKSLISSHFKSSSRSIVKIKDNSESQNSVEVEEPLNDELLSAYSHTIESPEEVLINKEMWSNIESAFGDKTDECAIYLEWLDGASPGKMSQALEIPVSEIYNAIKRGTRIVKTLFKRQS